MATNIQALQSVINLVVDAAKDTALAIQPGESLLARLSDYQNLIADVTALVPVIGDIPSEAKALQPADYAALLEGAVSRLAVTDVHAEAVINAALKLVNDLVAYIVIDIELLLAAVKAAPITTG